jgi:hypothetical protein
LGIRSKAQITINVYVKIMYGLTPFQKALICPNRIINTLVMEEKLFFFLGEGPGLGQGPGLLGNGFKIPNRLIGF